MQEIISNFMKFTNFFHLIIESKQELLNLGYPPWFIEHFVKNFNTYAHVVARWMKEYYGGKDKRWFYDLPEMKLTVKKVFTAVVNKHGIMNQFADRYRPYYDLTLQDVLDPTKSSDLSIEDRWQLTDLFFTNMRFFDTELGQTILNSNDNKWIQYRKLSFKEASAKWDKVIAFEDYPILYSYKDGWCWRKLESYNELIAELMGNCGDTASYEDKLVVLFDDNKKPRVLGTLSGNYIYNIVGRAESEITNPVLIEKLQEVLIKKIFQADDIPWYNSFPTVDPKYVYIMRRMYSEYYEQFGLSSGISASEWISRKNKQGENIDYTVENLKRFSKELWDSFEDDKKHAAKLMNWLQNKYK